MPSRHRFYRDQVKPLMDRYLAAIGLILAAPLLATVAAAVWWKFGRPVIFTQTRPGKNGRPFRLVKFRTMTAERDAAGQLLPDSVRLTPFGRWLRSTSLDELPELWNVLRGDMSLVGPRPLLPQYLRLYSTRQLHRHDVKPGITGLAQVHGRNAISWEQRFGYDLDYVDRLSLGLDAKILLRTLACVFRRDGISAKTHCTMPAFEGTADRHGSRKQAA